jgi:hypothetical protein
MAAGARTGGRRKGSPNRNTAATRERLATMGDPLAFLVSIMHGEPVTGATEKDGTTAESMLPTVDQRLHAAKVLADKLVPNAKDRTITFTCPPMATVDELPGAIGAILEAMSRGELTPAEAASIAGMVELKRKAIETLELEQRIRKLEERGAG